MSFHNKKRFDDDDEDLESLRLAALKSLATKKETTSPVNGGNAIEVLENGPIQRNISTVRPINTLDNANLHVRLDVTEPYIPQSVPNVGRIDWNYNTAYMGNIHAKPSAIPTLSPRSLAFVEKNNDILMKRKGEKSTRSPSPYREDFTRWSESPPPIHKRRSPSFRKSHSRTVSRSPLLNTRFSKSPPPAVKSPRRVVKSPIRNNRPFKKRSKSRCRNSRSPVRRGDSQTRIHPERRRSASLYSSSHQNKFNSRNAVVKQNDRLTPPPMRHRRPSRSQSPPVHPRNKSITPPPSQPVRTNRKRSRSPYQQPQHLKRSRSISRSPLRKARPRSREYGSGGGGGSGYQKGGNNNKHYANKNIEFNRKYLSQNNYSNRNNNKYHNNNSKYNNKYDNRREQPRSPVKYRSKSKSPVPHHHSENGSKPDNKKVISTTSSSSKIEGSKEVVPHNEVEHDKLSSTDDDDQNSTENDDNNDEDGIDLFASEESESENEGRFKSSSKNTDKKIPTLSYSKLSETAAVCVSELKDMNANSNWNDRDYSRRNNSDRDRDRDRKNSRRGGRDDNWKANRRNRTKDDENDTSRSNKKTEKPNSSNSGTANEMKMFRPTFQAVVDLNSKKENTSKSNEEKSISKNSLEGNSETRSVLHLKRSLIATKEVDKVVPSTDESTKTHETSVSSESTGGKKPIHLRLGAISNSSSKIGSGGGSGGSSGSQNQSGSKSNTSWKSKKSWRTEKTNL